MKYRDLPKVRPRKGTGRRRRRQIRIYSEAVFRMYGSQIKAARDEAIRKRLIYGEAFVRFDWLSDGELEIEVI